ncbi:hypothetical protein ABT404_08425 [Streptomyces hyaluromycini]|uniref:Uncharacterized protein n=1 Tax=Streptomyces hyaluromycini TaxID=1377993 RepID=A0ABV1WRN9_9ACTN
MIDRFSVSGFRRKPGTGHDANIPQVPRGETRRLSAWAGTVQLSAFLALLVLPVILVTDGWQTLHGAVLLAMASGAARHSGLRYLRLRAS